jgi:glutamate-ammonia-ligase adenylyltransferase
VSTAHPEGAGYELDTRLRPSGSHGLLVTSLDAFARYHHVGTEEGPATERATGDLSVLHSGAPWERQALIRARFAAGDLVLGAAVIRIAHVAAYERGAPPAEELHRLRMRLERELARERPGRYDLKLGRGGLADIEFGVQYLQMRNGFDTRVRTAETSVALEVLRKLDVLGPGVHAIFQEGYRFLRRLEQRIRIVHGTSACLLDENAEGLVPLARRMGIRSTPRSDPSRELIARYRDVTDAVRRAYLEVIAVEDAMGDSLGHQS